MKLTEETRMGKQAAHESGDLREKLAGAGDVYCSLWSGEGFCGGLGERNSYQASTNASLGIGNRELGIGNCELSLCEAPDACPRAKRRTRLFGVSFGAERRGAQERTKWK